MTEITSVKQFSNAVAAFQNEHPYFSTNCFLMPEELTVLCSQKALLLSQTDGFLKVLCNRDSYYDLYYYIDNSASSLELTDVFNCAGEKDVLVDVVLPARNKNDVAFPINQLTERKLISKYKCYQRMQLNVSKIDIDGFSCHIADGYTVSTAFCDYGQLMNLWTETLDEKSTPLPDEERIKKLSEDGLLVSVLDGKGALCAAVMLTVQGKQATIQHLAVSKAHRRKGLAALIFQKTLVIAKNNGIKLVKLWVDEDNLPAISLYIKEGFLPDGRICKQYLTERKL